MIISYAILVHSNPKQMGRLIDKLQAPDSMFFVHIDKKTDILPFKEQVAYYSNVIFTDKRWNVKWGDYSVLGAYIECLKEIKSKAPQSFVIHLSGQDYPLKNTQYIRSFVEQNSDRIFMSYFVLPNENWWGNGGLDRIFNYYYNFGNRRYASIKPLSLSLDNFKNISKTIVFRPLAIFSVISRFFLKRTYPLSYKNHFGGEFWISMPSNVSDWIIDMLADNPKIEQFYRLCEIPDEIMFHTLILNQKELVTTVENNCIKYINWSGKRGQLPLTLTIEEKREIEQVVFHEPSKLFARKFDTTIDCSILDYIDSITM